MDDGYETGTTTAPSSSTSNKSRSPHRSSSCSSAVPPPLVLSKRSVGSGSLPSPAHITDEARRVLEAFLQRSLSIDRGSTGSVAAILPRHLEVIEEIRHTRIRTSSYKAANKGSESGASPQPGVFASREEEADSVDGVSVKARVVGGGDEQITDMEVQHHHAPDGHATDIDVHLCGEDGITRVLHTHVTHPPISAADAVTTGAMEMFMDASLSRQQSTMDGEAVVSPEPQRETPFSDGRPSTANYEADGERALSSAATEKRKKKKKLSRESIRTWLRTTLRRREGEETAASPDEEDGPPEFRALAQPPKYYTMESTSSTTSTSTFGGAPARSVIHRGSSEDKPKRKKRRLRRRSLSQKQQSAEGSSFFHQLFRLKLPKLFHTSEPSIAQGHHRNSVIIADMLAQQQMEQFEKQQQLVAGSPESETAVDGATSMPDLLSREDQHREVGEMFRCAIEKRNSSGSGVRVEASTNAVIRRIPSPGGDEVDATAVAGTDGGVVKQVDRTTLRLDLGSSSNSQSSSGQSGSGGGAQLSSPDQLGPDGVASKRDVDKVARLLDKLADEINLAMTEKRNRTESTLSEPPMPGRDKRRHSLPDNSPSKSRGGNRRSRPGSARCRAATSASESGDGQTVTTSASTPLLGVDVPGDEEFDPQRALRAKAHRIKHQSSECLVNEGVLERLNACNSYEEFSLQLRCWFGSGSAASWKQIALLYHLTRKLVRQVSRNDDNDERVATIKDYTMKFFHENFAEFVLRRGGWQNVIEDTEDSELD